MFLPRMENGVGFTRAVAHDLRAGLHAVGLALETAREQASGSAARYLDLATAECGALDRFIEDLLILSRLAGGERTGPAESVNLGELVTSVFADPAPDPWIIDRPSQAVLVVCNGDALLRSLGRLRETLGAWRGAEGPPVASVAARPQPALILTGPGLWAPLARAAGLPGADSNTPDGRGAPARAVVALALMQQVCAEAGGSGGAAPVPPDRFQFRWHWPAVTRRS